MYRKKYFYYNRRKRRKKFFLKNISLDIVFFIILIFIIFVSFNFIKKNKKINIENISCFDITYPTFLILKDLSKSYKLDFNEFLTYYFIEENFFKQQKKSVSKKYIEEDIIKNYKKIKNKNKNIKKNYKYIFDTLFSEIKYFPINYNNKNNSYIYLNDLDKNLNNGINIIDRENVKEEIEVLSMTDGIINKKIYNKDQSFKLEIISNKEICYIYSNLYKFTSNIKIGNVVKAGDIIGYINKNENNKKYLNVKILIKGKNIKGEYFINPYIFLRNIENK